MNLLRESNIQLREENKHNFEECQVLYFIFLTGESPYLRNPSDNVFSSV